MSVLKAGQRHFLKNHTWIQLQSQCGNMNTNTARSTTARTPTPKNNTIKYPPSVPAPTPLSLSLSLPQVPVEWYKENNYRYIDVGITDRGIDDIGDVTGVKPCFTNTGMHTHTSPHSHSHSSTCTEKNENENINIPVWKLKQEETVLEIQWDAHLITSADELYHTVWETVSETSMIRAPFKGVFVFSEMHSEMHMHSDSHSHFEVQVQKGRRRGYVLDSDVPLFTMLVDQDCLDAEIGIGGGCGCGDDSGEKEGYADADADANMSSTTRTHRREGGRLMDYDAYMEFVETLERGKFHEDDII